MYDKNLGILHSNIKSVRYLVRKPELYDQTHSAQTRLSNNNYTEAGNLDELISTETIFLQSH